MQDRNLEAPVLPQRSWQPFWVLALAVTAGSGLLLVRGGFSVEAVRMVIRLTAQMSLLLFCTAFAASSLRQLWPTPATGWLLRHRRQFGLAFAFSHGVHALALLAFARMDSQQFQQVTDTGMFVFGGLAYLFIIAMAATSFDRTAAWLGPRAWRLLHTVGAWDIWLTFLVAESKRAVHNAAYWPYVLILLLALGLRLLARNHSAQKAINAGKMG